MSIKNPYRKVDVAEIPTMPHVAFEKGLHNGWGEGVKAANEDWIKWFKDNMGWLQGRIDDPDMIITFSHRQWAERKKEINQ